MYALARPLLFLFPPGAAHSIAVGALGIVEHLAPFRALTRALCTVRDPKLERTVMGLTFPTPIGIAGGFDKNATRVRALAALGFGFLELGTVTAEAQGPNPAPNLFRLPRDRALINRLGFPNEGAAAVVERFVARGGRAAIGIPVGFSIGKSRSVPVGDAKKVEDDYRASFRTVHPVSDFIVINVSSPNTKDLRKMQGGAELGALLVMISRENKPEKPVLVKVAPDLDDDALDAILDVVREAKIAGVVATNTTIRRDGLATPADEVAALGAGGLSGPPLRVRTLAFVERARKRLGRDAVVIGVGGVETGGDVHRLLEAGADLVQIYTSFIYRGPFTARALAMELLRAREQNGNWRSELGQR